MHENTKSKLHRSKELLQEHNFVAVEMSNVQNSLAIWRKMAVYFLSCLCVLLLKLQQNQGYVVLDACHISVRSCVALVDFVKMLFIAHFM